MAVASMNFYSTLNEKLNNIAVVDGNDIFVRDKRRIYVDAKGERTEYGSILSLSTDQQRLNIATPFEGFYYVKETNALWHYENEWKALNALSDSDMIFLDGGDESLPQEGKEKALYVTDNSIMRWKNGQYTKLGGSVWEDMK